MKWQYWLGLEILIELGTIAWIYFFPDNALVKAIAGFVLLYCIEVIRNED